MWQGLILDVNETLLDLSALDPLFEELFGDAAARRDWFGRVITSALTQTAVDRYQPFDTIAARALDVTGRHYGHPPSDEATTRIGAAMRRLPPHPDVPGALAQLREQGHRLVALSNSRSEVLADQLARAGLADAFDKTLSAEAAGRLKPAPAVYRYAAEQLGTPPAELLMIAAHGWDLAGAASAGMATAFIERPGQYPEPLFPEPRLCQPDLATLAQAIAANSADLSPGPP